MTPEQKIEAEAEALYKYPKSKQFGKYYYDIQRRAYIAGRSAGLEREKELEEENEKLNHLAKCQNEEIDNLMADHFKMETLKKLLKQEFWLSRRGIKEEIILIAWQVLLNEHGITNKSNNF